MVKKRGVITEENITWQIDVPIFKNPLILSQLGIAVGIPFGLLAVILAISTGDIMIGVYILLIISGLLFLTWLFMLAVYGGKYEAEFVLDNKGALCRTRSQQAKKNRIVNSLTIFLGLFAKRPGAAGAGILAQSRQEVLIRWNRITKVKYMPKSRTILIKSGWFDSIALFCSEENYSVIEQVVIDQTKHINIEN